MQSKNISNELWREYEFGAEPRITYRIKKPILLYAGKTTHRIVAENGVVHCVPAPGYHGCVLRWEAIQGSIPVQF